MIELVARHTDPDEQDRLIIHEICHAVSDGGHGKNWQDRMAKAAMRADELGRHRLAQLLREEIEGYEQATTCLEAAYNDIRDALTTNPDLTFPQVERWLAQEFEFLLSEVCHKFRLAKKVFEEAKREAQEHRAMMRAWLTVAHEPT